MLVAHMDWAGIDRAVLLQGPFYGECNDYVIAATRAYPKRLMGLAYLDPWDAKSRSKFQFITEMSEFVGIKIEFSEATGLSAIHPNAKLDDTAIRWLWSSLADIGMMLVIDLGAIGSASYQTAALKRIATQNPNLTIVIAHLAQPNPVAEKNDHLWSFWEEQISLGLLDNVYFDTASLPAYVSPESYPFPTASRYLQAVIRRIGPDKVMWGTDVPSSLAFATYPELLKYAQLSLEWLSESERTKVMGTNAERLFKRQS